MLAIETCGSPFERGRQQGQSCGDLARCWMERVLTDLAQRLGCDTVRQAVARVDGEVSRIRRQTRRSAPEVIDLCCGIAEGMGWDPGMYFTATTAWQIDAGAVACSLLGWRDGQGRPMFAKTDDVARHERACNVLEIVRPDQGYRHAAFHAAGTVWTVAGMNEAGLAMGMTGIPGAAVCAEGCSSLMALHAILPSCATVDEALECIEGQVITYYGYSLMLADAGGNLALVEKNAAGMAVLAPQDGGWLAHTNHILDARLGAVSCRQVEPIGTNGVRRYETIRRMAGTLTHDAAGLEAFLSDRSDDGAIWQEGADGLFTDFGVICLPHERQLRFWTQCPAGAEARTIDVKALFSDRGDGGHTV